MNRPYSSCIIYSYYITHFISNSYNMLNSQLPIFLKKVLVAGSSIFFFLLPQQIIQCTVMKHRVVILYFYRQDSSFLFSWLFRKVVFNGLFTNIVIMTSSSLLDGVLCDSLFGCFLTVFFLISISTRQPSGQSFFFFLSLRQLFPLLRALYDRCFQ